MTTKAITLKQVEYKGKNIKLPFDDSFNNCKRRDTSNKGI